MKLEGFSAYEREWDRLDYKRFISYLYSYVEGEKGVNVGYIRCEQRQGICRFTLNLQDRQGIEDGHYKVYLYRVEKDGTPVGYYLDEMTLHQCSGELRKQTPCKNVWNTNSRIEDFDGVIAVYDKEHMYASQWSDEPIQTGLFLTYSDWLEKKGTPGKSASEYKRESEGLFLHTREARQLQNESVVSDGMEFPEAAEDHSVPFRDGTPDMQMMREQPAESGKAIESRQTAEPGQAAETGQGKATETFSSETSQEMAGDLTQVIAEEIAERITDADNQKEQKREAGNKNRKSISDLTIRVMENRPKLPDFENHEIFDCVRIEPNDIGLLEMDNWRLGVNSFLTHGYYNYKYLMLGKLRFQDGVVKAVLGVPGVFDNKEQYIARIFGFDVFVPIKHTNVKTGNFGYWIVELV